MTESPKYEQVPVLGTLDIDDPDVATTELCTAKKLTAKERRHLNKIRSVHHQSTGKPKQDSIDYWSRKFRECTIHQLRRHYKRIGREARIIGGRLKHSNVPSYKERLARAATHFKSQLDCLIAEFDRRGIKD